MPITLNEEDSERLLADLERGCSPEEIERRTFAARVYINRTLAGAESAALSASPIACAVADAWAHAAQKRMADYADLHTYAPGIPAALDALEAATRESPLRKVRS